MNELVFNEVASELQTQISGATSTGLTKHILVDTSGNIQIIGTVTVTAGTVNLGGRLFTEDSANIANLSSTGVALPETVTQNRLYSYYVTNIGTAPLSVKIQISPTTAATYFYDDPSGETVVTGGNKTVLAASRYLKHTRLYYNAGSDCSTAIFSFNSQV